MQDFINLGIEVLVAGVTAFLATALLAFAPNLAGAAMVGIKSIGVRLIHGVIQGLAAVGAVLGTGWAKECFAAFYRFLSAGQFYFEGANSDISNEIFIAFCVGFILGFFFPSTFTHKNEVKQLTKKIDDGLARLDYSADKL